MKWTKCLPMIIPGFRQHIVTMWQVTMGPMTTQHRVTTLVTALVTWFFRDLNTRSPITPPTLSLSWSFVLLLSLVELNRSQYSSQHLIYRYRYIYIFEFSSSYSFSLVIFDDLCYAWKSTNQITFNCFFAFNPTYARMESKLGFMQIDERGLVQFVTSRLQAIFFRMCWYF